MLASCSCHGEGAQCTRLHFSDSRGGEGCDSSVSVIAAKQLKKWRGLEEESRSLWRHPNACDRRKGSPWCTHTLNIAFLRSLATALLLTVAAACPSVNLVYLPSYSQINATLDATNKYGMEDGIVVRRADGGFSLIGAEMYADEVGEHAAGCVGL